MNPHKTELRVRFGETDASGVVFFANYFNWINVAGESLFRDLGFDLQQLRVQERMAFVATNASASYFAPARHNDILEILTSVKEVGEKPLGFHLEFVRKDDGRTPATGEVSLKCVRLDEKNGLCAADIPTGLARRMREQVPPVLDHIECDMGCARNHTGQNHDVEALAPLCGR